MHDFYDDSNPVTPLSPTTPSSPLRKNNTGPIVRTVSMTS